MFLVISCLDQPDCFQLNNNLIGITFRVLGSTKADTVDLVSVTLNGVDQIFFDSVRATGVELPLNLATGQTEVLFKTPSGATFALPLEYLIQKQFVSEDCGSRFILSDLRVANSDAFDSVLVVNPTPGRSASTNVVIFRCPQTDILALSFRQLYINGGGDQTSQFKTSPLESVTPEYLGTPLYTNTSATTVYLPVRLTPNVTDSTHYTFDFGTNFKGSEPLGLTVKYRVTRQKRYNVCPEQDFVSALKIGSTDFDSVSLVINDDGDTLNTLSDPPETNIQVYRCPDTNLAQITFRRTITGSTNTRQDTVSLKSITTDYSTEVFYPNTTASIIQLPVNTDADNTLFYLEYDDRRDTISLSYERTPQVLFPACKTQVLISQLESLVDTTNIKVSADSIRFPVVTNIEVRRN
jgi:hypothetical protein